MGRFIGYIALCVSFISLSAVAKVVITREGNVTQYDFTVDRVSFSQVEVDYQKFLKVSLEGLKGFEGIEYAVGRPAMPVIRFFVAGDAEIEVIANPESNEPLPNVGLLWVPALDSVEKLPGRRPVLRLDSWAYSLSAAWAEPVKPFEIESLGSVRGAPQRLVTLHPVRYYPGDGRYSIVEQFRVRVVSKVAAKGEEQAPETIAFIVGKAWAEHPAVTRYEAHKRSQGMQVVRIAVDGNSPSEIRAKLQEIYRSASHSLRHAIIIGDHADVPGYQTTLLTGVTDHYYRSIDTDSYDTDIGSPDIGVGRLSPSSATDLDVIIGNLIRYDRVALQANPWTRWYSFIASDDPNYWKVAEGSLDYAIDNYTSKLGLLGDFPILANVGGDKLYAITHRATRPDVVKQIQAGRGFVNYGGHGWVNYWAAPQMMPSDVHSLTDPNALPVVISNACLTGKFTDDSFAEIWQRHGAGSVFFWGSMDSSYWDEDDILQRAMYDVMFRDKKIRFEEFTHLSLAEVWRHYGGAGRSKYYWETYNSFGDPSMRFRDGIIAR